jgi:hypothetical protein
MRRVFNEAVVSAAALALLLAVLVSFDARVRDHFAHSLRVANIESASARFADTIAIVVGAARDRTVEHAAMTLFVVAAAVLVFFMLRT